MRPINKFPIGTSVTLGNGEVHIVQKTYNPYQNAKEPLCINFGQYCVYCEAPFCYERGLSIEHILPKDPKLGFSHLMYHWDNFLLGCPTCNDMGNKGNKVMTSDTCHFPHLNNTYISLQYDKGGVVKANQALCGKSYDKANALLKLVGLDKTPETSSPHDKRWNYRMTQWDIAERYKRKYENGNVNLDCLIDYIKLAGCWSIWFTVFNGHDEVRRRLIEDFPGTATQCFDAENHFNPIERNPGEEDPI